MSKIKEMFEAMINDPDLENNPMFKESEKFGKALDELTARIIQPCMDYANNHGDEDEGWAYTVLISMARATCKMLYALQHTAAEDGKDIYEFYHDELLPLCKEIAYRESDEMIKRAEQMASEVDEEDEGGVPFDRKKEVILAIADPDMPMDEIIEKFFKKDMTDEERKMVSDHIAKVRVVQADKLQRLREHTDENGNYKA
jgi:hypothetical protein